VGSPIFLVPRRPSIRFGPAACGWSRWNPAWRSFNVRRINCRVQELIGAARLHYRYYRYFFQIVFRQRAGARGAVLLGANSMGELDALAARLQSDSDAVCDGASPHCAAFPEACTVAIEIRVVVNGAARSMLWGSLLDSVAMHPRKLQLLRLHDGRLTPVRIDVADPNALRLPLLPGDRVDWE